MPSSASLMILASDDDPVIGSKWSRDFLDASTAPMLMGVVKGRGGYTHICFGFREKGLYFRVQGLWFRIWVLGFRVQGLGWTRAMLDASIASTLMGVVTGRLGNMGRRSSTFQLNLSLIFQHMGVVTGIFSNRGWPY